MGDNCDDNRYAQREVVEHAAVNVHYLHSYTRQDEKREGKKGEKNLTEFTATSVVNSLCHLNGK